MALPGGEITPSAMPRTEEFSLLLNCLIADDQKGAILNDGSVIDFFFYEQRSLAAGEKLL